MKRVFLILLLVIWPGVALAESKPLPRKLIALFDSRETSAPRMTLIHRFLEMPANHVGFDIHYHDVNQPLPSLSDDFAGIVLWFSPGNAVPDTNAYLGWLESNIEAGKKLIIIENAGMGEKERLQDTLMQRYNKILSTIGIQDSNQWNAVTYRSRVDYINKAIAGFEREIGPVLPPYGSTHVIPGRATSHLRLIPGLEEEEEPIDLIATSKQGGYIAEGYAVFHVVENDESRINQWFVNPFIFLRESLGADDMPVPDVTTMNGRRIFYSHIDGDGWNNLSEMPEHQKNPKLASEIVKDEIINHYNDFAFTVGLIIADVDPECFAIQGSERVAREIFALPNVEPSSHTHSHPLYWSYFANYSAGKEAPILKRYPRRPKERASLAASIRYQARGRGWDEESKDQPVATSEESIGRNDDDTSKRFDAFDHKQYETPRSYACTPFLLDQEIAGSIAKVNELSPPDKKARLIQWSGDTAPFIEALRKTREAGFYNINGGDSRFDNEYPSYSSVAPIGLNVGSERQIYSSNSNENTYTNLWTGRFFGFRYLQTTVMNTETPMRVRPFNIYFHMYSGQKEASLLALKENFDFARTQPVIPITATDFAMIANGFYTTQITPAPERPKSWRISNRGKLQSFRFDNAGDQSVDFTASIGVTGQQYHQGSLYVSLDPYVNEAVITLKNNNNISILPIETIPYLIDSRWAIKDLQLSKSLLTMRAHGYGAGDMRFMMGAPGEYQVTAQSDETPDTVLFEALVTTDARQQLSFSIPASLATKELMIRVSNTKAGQ
jgi:hypothetical protein